MQPPPADASPLSARLAPVNQALNICLQTELQCASACLHTFCDFTAYQQMFLDPAIKVIRSELDGVKVSNGFGG